MIKQINFTGVFVNFMCLQAVGNKATSIIQQFNDCEAFGQGLVRVHNDYGGCHKHLCLVTII